MILFRKTKALLFSALLLFIFILIYVQVTHKFTVFLPIVLMDEGNAERDFNPGELACEKVWNRVIEKREKAFTLQIKPSRHLIEEFLEIVSENATMCAEIPSVPNNDSVKILVILVNSAIENFKERQVLRESWGSTREYFSGNVKWHVRTVYLVAQANYCTLNCKNISNWMDTKSKEIRIENEQKKNGDLVIGSFTDTYRNNSYKQLMGFKFVLERCSQADLIVKTDDDVFVNIPAILNERMEELKRNNRVSDMYCPVLKNFKPGRRKEYRYYVTGEEWPYNAYPDFCAGAFFVLSFEWMKMLYSVRHLGGFFWIDDTFVGGVLREIAEWEYEKKARFLNIYKQVWWNGMKIGEICVNVSERNVIDRRNQLPMFAQVERNDDMEYNMKCLTNITKGKPF